MVWCFIFLLCSINLSLGYCVPCAYPRICSNCASACFHILGFIAREHCDRGDPVIIKSHAVACGHNLLDCFVSLAMTGMCGAAYLGTEWELVLELSDHPAAARHPSNGGELGVVLFVIAREHCDRGDPVIIKSRIRACIIDWIAAPSAMARNDKKRCAHNYLDPGVKMHPAPMDDKSVKLSTGMAESSRGMIKTNAIHSGHHTHQILHNVY